VDWDAPIGVEQIEEFFSKCGKFTLFKNRLRRSNLETVKIRTHPLFVSMNERKLLKLNENVSKNVSKIENVNTLKVDKSLKDFYMVLCSQIPTIHFNFIRASFL
jgi:hypothetical protein